MDLIKINNIFIAILSILGVIQIVLAIWLLMLVF
jgi:hypothetical protein